ncbi:protein of unknown function [Burkholderia multivorans]
MIAEPASCGADRQAPGRRTRHRVYLIVTNRDHQGESNAAADYARRVRHRGHGWARRGDQPPFASGRNDRGRIAFRTK